MRQSVTKYTHHDARYSNGIIPFRAISLYSMAICLKLKRFILDPFCFVHRATANCNVSFYDSQDLPDCYYYMSHLEKGCSYYYFITLLLLSLISSSFFSTILVYLSLCCLIFRFHDRFHNFILHILCFIILYINFYIVSYIVHYYIYFVNFILYIIIFIL